MYFFKDAASGTTQNMGRTGVLELSLVGVNPAVLHEDAPSKMIEAGQRSALVSTTAAVCGRVLGSD